MPAFFAFLNHVHSTLKPTLHTPIMLIAQPAWTAKNHEDLTAFMFEKFKTPALCIMDSALATTYAFGIANATVVDVGYQKVDITAVTDFQISARSFIPGRGGDAMTGRLHDLLENKGWTRDMCEQMKRNPMCEILPPSTPLPVANVVEEVALPVISNPAAAASTGAIASGPILKVTEVPSYPGTDNGEEDDGNGEDGAEDNDGVLDVASIVTSGKTQEFLAKKEKEKAEKAVARKAVKDAKEAAEAAAAKPIRLPNYKRSKVTFHYEETMQGKDRRKSPEPPEPAPVVAVDDAQPAEDAPAPASDAAPAAELEKEKDEIGSYTVRRDMEVGLERFGAADGGFLDAIADTIYRTILKIDEISKRQDSWDALIICGAGSKVRGFREALVGTLNGRYLVSPSSATMFMSELPSNLATPSGTGSMTPNPQLPSFSSLSHLPNASGVNPLLLAATSASARAMDPQPLALPYGGASFGHSSHSQSPTSIKIATPPTYFPEWKSHEEAVFVGSQVAAKVIFVVDQGLSKGFLSRVEFNEEGPAAIHQL